jgi:DNA invertase Pin-like site-specific DNA recombinase
MSTALIYIRQSRHKEYERTASPEVQEAWCRALPAVSACDQVEVFTDLDKSGRGTKKRTGFLALIRRIEASEKGSRLVVAAYDQSRLNRNSIDSLQFFATIEERPWIDLVLVDGHFERSPAGGLTWGVMALTAEHLAKTTAEKIRAAKRYRSSLGEAVGPLPFGYVLNADGQVVEVQPDAAIVRRVFADYASGAYSARLLAERLNIEGIRMRQGRPWRGDTVTGILGNVAYTGMTYSESRRHKSGQLIPAVWPALVDSDLFAVVQRRRKRYWHHSLKAERTILPAAFRGLLLCDCGKRMRIQRNSMGRRYYQCHPDGLIGAHAVRIPEATILPWAHDLMTRLDAIRPGDFDQAVADAAGKAVPVSAETIESIDRAIERKGKRFEWGHIPEAEYLSEVARLRSVREQLLAKPKPAAVRLTGLLEAWDSDDPQVRNELLLALFDGLRIKDGEIVAYIPRFEHAAEVTRIMEKCAESEREGFEPSNEVAPVTAFPVPRPRPD